MIQIGISELSKNPAMLDKLHDVAQIVNKKTSEVKGIFVPSEYIDMFDKVFKEIEYKKFVQRNYSLQSNSREDETLLDGLDDIY